MLTAYRHVLADCVNQEYPKQHPLTNSFECCVTYCVTMNLPQSVLNTVQ